MSGRATALRRRLGRPSGWLLLLAIWVTAWGSYTTASIVGGVVATAVVMLLFPDPEERPTHKVRPLMLLRYAGYYLKELTLANIHVAQAVLRPSRVQHRRAIVEVQLPPSSSLVKAVLANGVMLTPGTSIIEVADRPSVFHVHVLELHTVEEVRHSIAEMHWRLVRALGPEDCLDEVRTDLEELRRAAEEASS